MTGGLLAVQLVRAVQPEHVESVLEVRCVEMILPSMSDEEFAGWLRSAAREKTVQEAEAFEKERDREAGPWVGNEIVRHEYGESRDLL